jgi:hypothetical protein
MATTITEEDPEPMGIAILLTGEIPVDILTTLITISTTTSLPKNTKKIRTMQEIRC